MWFLYLLVFTCHVFITDALDTSTVSPIENTTMTITTKQRLVPKEQNITVEICPFGSSFVPAKSCQKQQECQTPMRINAYCSEKGICCQEESEGSESLCYDKRLPLLGEPKCSSDSDCTQYGAVCKSKHCCPNFHYRSNEPLLPPTHFYVSNFSCVPGKPLPPGFQFSYCSDISKTVTYLGVVNSCGDIQNIHKYSKCHRDSDCYPGYICVRTIVEGMCFKNPEDCSNSPYYYIAVISCYLSFVLMLLYFFTRACYEHPLRISAKFPILTLQLYSVTKEAELQAYDIYGGEELSKMQIEHISKEAACRAWIENEKSSNAPALEHLLNWLGYVVQYSDDEETDEEEAANELEPEFIE
ncbi:hypothetical protein B9Z55_019796 [Caenorhabditis nigoni]|uniref:Domain of unknown function DX domain-containing protein n=1 Tax=Caenorhabditis nigoni TaxID=1611254 RepID=A0A2G5TJX7_9PELO|nr:hypothetical protein B9Z55_019796 [Caenorhabditis nigoni]